jgi:putative hydrolase of the HAD superfamily
VDAVVFDWGGTLAFLPSPTLEEIWENRARVLAPGRSQDLLRAILEEEERIATSQEGSDVTRIVTAAGRTAGVRIPPQALSEVVADDLTWWAQRVEPDPDAPEVLAALRGWGLRVGLLCNTHWTRTFLEEQLARAGISGYFHALSCSCDLPYRKPHPSAFRAALDAIGVRDPAKAAYVGDRPWEDIWGAKNAGLYAIQRATLASMSTGEDTSPDATISALPELLDVLARL